MNTLRSVLPLSLPVPFRRFPLFVLSPRCVIRVVGRLVILAVIRVVIPLAFRLFLLLLVRYKQRQRRTAVVGETDQGGKVELRDLQILPQTQ